MCVCVSTPPHQAARVKAAEEERETLRRELEAAKRAQVANATSQGAAAASAVRC